MSTNLCHLRSILLGSLLVLGLSASAQTVTTGYFTGADNNALFFRMVGTGPETVVFLHGGPGFDMADGGFELDALGVNRRLIAYDQRGGGSSQEITDTQLLSYDRHVEDLEALRVHFGIDKLSIIGQSWGSGLAMLYAFAYPQNVERIVLLSPLPIRQVMFSYRSFLQNKIFDPVLLARFIEILGIDPYSVSDQEMIDLCNEYIPIILSPYFTPVSDLNNLNGDNCGAPPDGIRRRFGLNGIIFGSIGAWDWRTQATQVNFPVLAMDGEWTSVPKTTTREWAYYIPGAKVDFVPQAGHLTYLDNPVALTNLLETFLDGNLPATAVPVGRRDLDLVASYPLASDLDNASDTAQHAIQEGSISDATDRFNQAGGSADFANGAKGRVVDPGWTPDPANWSWSTWVWIKSTNDRTILEEGPARLWIDHRKPTMTLGCLEIASNVELTKKQWHHIAVVRDGDKLSLYQDGQLAAQGDSTSLPALSGDFTFSNNQGRLDDINIYARSLTAADVTELNQ